MTDKQLHGQIVLKDDGDAGDFRILFSTFDAVDLDRDIVLASAIPNEMKLPLLQAHQWGELAIGGGAVINDGKTAVLEGGFITESSVGADAHATAKALHKRGIRQEASWGFKITAERAPDSAEAEKGAERVIVETQPFEVSTVLRGAGVGTQLLDVKSVGGDRFKDHVEQALAACETVLQRAENIAELRAKDGRTLSGREALDGLQKRMHDTADTLAQLLADPEAPRTADPIQQLARFQAIGNVPIGAPDG